LPGNGFPDRNRMVVVRAPEKTGLVIPDQAKLAAVLKATGTKDLKPYVDAIAGATLLDSMPAPGKVSKSVHQRVSGHHRMGIIKRRQKSCSNRPPSGRMRFCCAPRVQVEPRSPPTKTTSRPALPAR
jgi:hypothetical protein